MIVVFGPKHYGRDNIQNRYGFCQHCGAHGLLSSYDTSAFFTIYYIPLIPLGRRRILDACPSCQMHRKANLRKYRRQRDEALRQALQGMKDAPEDPEKAVEAIRAYVAFGARQDFLNMAPVLTGKHAQHAGLHGVVGAGYEYYGDAPAAEPHYRQAAKLVDSPENREALAVNLIYLDRPDEARPCLEHVVTGSDPEKTGLLYLLAGAYREVGRHAEAVELYEAIEQLDPAAKDEEEHQRLKTSSRDRLADGAPVAAQLGRPKPAPESKGVPTLLPRMVPGALVALVLGGYLSAAVSKGLRVPVWLVSGTATPYSAAINGQSYDVPPFGVRKIGLKEGTWEIVLSDTPFPVGPVTVAHRTPFFSRPFRYPTVVLNPDGIAVLVKETTTYSTDPDLTEPNRYELFCGEHLATFGGVQFPFADFPEEIELSSVSDVVERSKLFVLEPDGASSTVEAALGLLSPEGLRAHLRQRARLEPDDLINVSLLHAFCTPDVVDDHVAFLREGLAARPLLIDWHRMYQEAMQSFRPDHDLVGEYRALVEAEPDVAGCRYLLGRVIPDPAEARRLFLADDEGANPTGYGSYAAAYQDLCFGKFADALAVAEKAVTANPEHPQFTFTYQQAQLAHGHYEDLLTSLQAERQEDPLDADLIETEVLYLTLLGRTNEASEAERAFLVAADRYMDDAGKQSWQHYLAAIRYHALGDVASHLEHLEKAELVDTAFRIGLLREDLDAVRKAVSGEEAETGFPYTSYLLAYGLARKQNRPDEARDALDLALEQLDAGSFEERQAAGMLRAETVPDRESLEQLLIQSGPKAVLAVALGLKYPRPGMSVLRWRGCTTMPRNSPGWCSRA